MDCSSKHRSQGFCNRWTGIRSKLLWRHRHPGRGLHDVSGHLDAADDEGSLAEVVVALFVLSIASTMLITFAMTSMRSERRLHLKAEALNMLEEHSAVARRIDCVQYAGRAPLDNTKACGPAPASGLKVTLQKGIDTTATPPQSGHALIELEWEDYYQLENCGADKDSVPVDYPRAIRKITVKWDDDSATGEDRSVTRTVIGPAAPHSRGWVHKQTTVANTTDSSTKTDWAYTLTSTVTETVRSTTYHDTSKTADNKCRILVGRPGQFAITGQTCKLSQGWNDYKTACNNSSSF